MGKEIKDPRIDPPHEDGKPASASETKPAAPETVGLERLIELEKGAILERRGHIYLKSTAPAPPLTGLSLSGGGIRSACFNLGLLEGLDRLSYEPPETSKLKVRSRLSGGYNHLELFDYVSSVSGGSYAAGHLATAMLPENLDPNSGEPLIDPETSKPMQPHWLGKVPLTSKTVPGWLWGVGVWFLGVAFQLLKTGSLLIGSLAFLAFMMRTLDSPDAGWFTYLMGFRTDLSRGFLPFWFVLGIFLVGYWIRVENWGRASTAAWFRYSFVIVLGYVLVINFSGLQTDITEFSEPIRRPPFWVHYFFLMALPAPVIFYCLCTLLGRGMRRIAAYFKPAAAKAEKSGISLWIRVENWGRASTAAWFHYSVVIVLGYVLVINFSVLQTDIAEIAEPIWRPPFWVHYFLLMALPAPVICTLLGRGTRRIAAFFKPAGTEVEKSDISLRTALLFPILLALFCFAGLVTTGDIDLWSSANSHSPEQIIESQKKAREYAETGQSIYNTALVVLGITSLVFFFPKRLFKSVRTVEDSDFGKTKSRGSGLNALGLEPIFRVVVFLCGYGFVLLVVFVLFGMVAQENVSGYYEWREDQKSAAFHTTEISDSEHAWHRIAQDYATLQPESKVPHSEWASLAKRLMKSHVIEGYSLADQKNIDAKARTIDAMPWPVRLLPPLMRLGPMTPWSKEGFKDLDKSFSTLLDLYALQYDKEKELAASINESILSRADLYKEVPYFGKSGLPVPAVDHERWERYLEKAQSLESLKPLEPLEPRDPAVEIAIRNNNRRALQLYLGNLMRDRGDKVVFGSIVWKEDQWARLWIAGIAGVIWVLCCAVDVNSFSLQKFYRGHVIDSWVKIPKGKLVKRWLHQTNETKTYRGYEYEKSADAAPPRRAPLLLINATQSGNRSQGDEPDLPANIFTFSPIASGSGYLSHWLNGKHPELSLARRSDLDIGNIVATSGAFLSPGNIANPALSAILHLFNIQTGYWAHDPVRFGERNFRESLRFHLYQSLGIDCDGDSRFMLTDGAHVENLGLYVLLQRKCSLIVVSDCSQGEREDEPKRRFDPLIQVLQQAHLDGIEMGPFLSSRGYSHWLATGRIPKKSDYDPACHAKRSKGLDLILPAVPERTKAATTNTTTTEAAANGKAPSLQVQDLHSPDVNFSQEHYLFAQIKYSEGPPGLLAYLRPTLTGDESDSLLHGAAESRFPDDDPVDQFYTPAKMNTYRLLGRHIARELMLDVTMKAALANIVSENAATTEPNHQKSAKPQVQCDSICDSSTASCVRNYQRSFRASAIVASECPTTPGQNGNGRENSEVSAEREVSTATSNFM